MRLGVVWGRGRREATNFSGLSNARKQAAEADSEEMMPSSPHAVAAAAAVAVAGQPGKLRMAR